jgi:hypothetical protein
MVPISIFDRIILRFCVALFDAPPPPPQKVFQAAFTVLVTNMNAVIRATIVLFLLLPLSRANLGIIVPRQQSPAL